RTIKIWDVAVAAGKVTTPLCTLSGHSSSVNCVAFSPDGRRLASASGESADVYRPGELKIWDLNQRRELASFNEPNGTVSSVAFNRDGRRLATASFDTTVKIWDTERLTAAKPSLFTLRGHSKGVLSVAFSPDGASLASASEDRTIRVWDVIHGVESLSLR